MKPSLILLSLLLLSGCSPIPGGHYDIETGSFFYDHEHLDPLAKCDVPDGYHYEVNKDNPNEMDVVKDK